MKLFCKGGIIYRFYIEVLIWLIWIRKLRVKIDCNVWSRSSSWQRGLFVLVFVLFVW